MLVTIAPWLMRMSFIENLPAITDCKVLSRDNIHHLSERSKPIIRTSLSIKRWVTIQPMMTIFCSGKEQETAVPKPQGPSPWTWWLRLMIRLTRRSMRWCRLGKRSRQLLLATSFKPPFEPYWMDPSSWIGSLRKMTLTRMKMKRIRWTLQFVRAWRWPVAAAALLSGLTNLSMLRTQLPGKRRQTNPLDVNIVSRRLGRRQNNKRARRGCTNEANPLDVNIVTRRLGRRKKNKHARRGWTNEANPLNVNIVCRRLGRTGYANEAKVLRWQAATCCNF